MGTKLKLAVMCTVLLAGIIALVACGRHSALQSGSQTVAPAAIQATHSRLQSVDDALTELSALECPEGVDMALWTELKGALAEALLSQPESRLSSRDLVLKESRLENRDSLLKEQDGHPAKAGCPYKSVAAPPTGEANRVNELGLADHEDGSYTLTWHYRNLGDYGQDGRVGIEDITPLAQHFNETYDPETEPHCLQAVIDGSGNGKVDIADVTPIAVHFGSECAAYSIRRSDSLPAEVGDTTELDTAPMEPEQWEERRVFSRDFALPPYTYIAVAPVDGEGALGDLSNVRYTPNHQPTAALAVDPTEGDAPLTVNLDAGGSYDPDGPLAKYEWDWEGDGVWDEDTGAASTAQHVYDTADYYYPAVRVTDSSGATATAEATVFAGQWRITVVDSAGSNFNSLAVIEGCPAISYWQDNALMYARAADPLGNSWGEPTFIDWQGANFCNALAVVNGRPALAYYSTGKLKYVRADDAYGSNWGASAELADAWAGAGENWGLSLMAIEGIPAIAYEGADQYRVSYIRALDANGDSWGTPQELIHMISAPSNCVMTEANGNPAICYWDDYWQYLLWLRASDDVGSIWGAPITVREFPPAAAGGRISLAVVNGNPAASHAGVEDDTDGLMYQRALDPGGITWGVPLMVDSWPEHGGWPTLATVNGRPAISYVELLEDRYTLLYSRAADADGTSWRSPVTVEGPPAGDGGPTYSSMAEVFGQPAISYAYMNPEQGVYELRFAIYY